VCDGTDNDGDTLVDEDYDLSPVNGIPDCTDAAADTDGDTVTNDLDPDDDNDGFSDAVENYIATDSLHACPDNTSDDAWPLDMDNDQVITILDVTVFTGWMFAAAGSAKYDRRLDLNANGSILIFDVQFYTGKLFQTCV